MVCDNQIVILYNQKICLDHQELDFDHENLFKLLKHIKISYLRLLLIVFCQDRSVWAQNQNIHVFPDALIPGKILPGAVNLKNHQK